MRIKTNILLSGLLLVLLASAANAQQIFSNTSGFTNPPMPNTNLNQAQGRKGFVMEFFLSTGANPPVQITAAGAAITFSVAGLPKTVEANTLTPAAGHAGFLVVDGITNDGIFNSIKIVFNGNFTDGDVIDITINGLTSAVGSFPQDHPYTLNYVVGPNLSRNPLTVALVLDVSGSMGLNIVGGAGRRIDALHHATEAFLNTVKGHAMLGDKVGVAYFTTNATPMDLPPAGVPLLIDAHIDSAIAAAIADVNAHNPTAATSIGRGLTTARDSLFVESPAGNSKNILIFSDGENNTPSATDVTSPPVTVTGAAFDSSITRICPFTMGDMTTPGNTLMSNIAADRCSAGNSHVVDVTVGGMSPDAQLMAFFQATMAELFVGDKLEVSKSVSGTVTAGTAKTEKFLVNPNDISMTIVLSWDSRRIRHLPFQLKAPGGKIIRAQSSTTPGDQNSVTTITLPVLQDGVRIPNAGEWELLIDGNLTQGFSTDYQMFVMLDNVDIASTFDAIGTDVGTGQDIPLRVSLKEGSAPILGATVTAQILGPSNGIGNILSTQKTTGDANSAGDVIRSAAQAKLQLLYENPATAGLFFSNGLPTVTLFDDGSSIHGDAVAGDGVYNAIFKDARLEGHYNFNFLAKGNATTNGAFERTRTRSVFVRPKADPASTVLTLVSSTVQPDNSVIVRLKATPKDRLNNFLGPDYLGHMNIRSSQGTLAQPLSDLLDGSYEISYRLPSASSNPDFTVEVMGTDVVTKSLGDLKNPTLAGFDRWAISLHSGSTFPHGFLASFFNPGYSFGADVEYRLTPLFSVEAYLGHDRFRSKFINDSFFMTHLSGQGKFTFGTGTVRPSLHAGLGAYFPEGGGTHFGGNVGGSIQFWVTPHFALEPSYNYRIVNFSGTNIKYSTLQGGIRFRF